MELATSARRCTAPSTIQRTYAVEKSNVQAEEKQSSIKLSCKWVSVRRGRQFERLGTDSEWKLGLAQDRASFPALMRNAVRPSSAAAVRVMRVNRKGW